MHVAEANIVWSECFVAESIRDCLGVNDLGLVHVTHFWIKAQLRFSSTSTGCNSLRQVLVLVVHPAKVPQNSTEARILVHTQINHEQPDSHIRVCYGSDRG